MRNEHDESVERKLTEESTKIMRARLKNEFKLYIFVKKRLLKQYEKCKNRSE